MVTLTAGRGRGGGGREGVLVVLEPSASPLLSTSLSEVRVPWTGLVGYGTTDADTAHGAQVFFDMCGLATITSDTEHETNIGAWGRVTWCIRV